MAKATGDKAEEFGLAKAHSIAPRPLHLLLVEDSEDDAELILLELKRLGFAPTCLRVESAKALHDSLQQAWDLVICDYNLPDLDAPTALEIVKRRHPDLPVLVMSGTTSEAQAIPTLAAGAQDFFNKDRLSRLGPAIERELKEAEGRRARRQAESALKRSEQRFKEVLENISDLIFLLSPDGYVLYASPSIELILGYNSAEIEGARLSALLGPANDLARLLENAHGNGNAPASGEIAFPRKDGAVALLEVMAKDATGKGLGYILNARDITARRKAENALALTEERLRMAIEAGRLGTWFMDISTGSIEVNEVGRRQVGWSDQDTLNFESFINRVHDSDRSRVQAEVERALSGAVEFNSKFRVTIGDAFGPGWVHAIGRAFRDENGKPDRFFGVALDVTESKRSEMLLVETQHRLKAALLGSNAGTFKLDLKTETMDCDTGLKELLGLPDTSLVGSSLDLLDRIHSEDRDRMSRALDAVIREGADLEEEVRIGSGPSLRWIAVKGRPFTGLPGKPAYMMGACVDITERRQVLEQLRQSQKMEAIGKLAGGVAHDFNNLLTVINGYADICLAHIKDGDELSQPLQEIRNSGARAASLTQQLLAYSRKQVLMPKPLCLDGIVLEMEKLMARLIGENIKISLALAAGEVMAMVDPGQMHQVILNLAVNSRDAMPEGGEIRLETSVKRVTTALPSFHGNIPPGEYVLLRFSDTGCGMGPEIQARIFEPFFTTKPVGQGTGLGLSMVYGMIRQSGGHISMQSAPGSGTTFEIYLPMVKGPAVGSALAQEKHAPGSPHETILLVEDEGSVLKFLGVILEQEGYRVIKAHDPARAIELLSAGARPELLITDVVMNGMGGFELWNRVCAGNDAMRVLFISGYTKDENLLVGLNGRGDFLQKPFSADALIEKIRKLLGRTELRTQA